MLIWPRVSLRKTFQLRYLCDFIYTDNAQTIDRDIQSIGPNAIDAKVIGTKVIDTEAIDIPVDTEGLLPIDAEELSDTEVFRYRLKGLH